MEETLWSLEKKWNLSTKKAIAIFACTLLLVMSICILGLLLKKRRKSRRKVMVGVHQDQETCDDRGIERCKGWRTTVKKALAGSMCWSGPKKWEFQGLRGSRRDGPTPLLSGGKELDVGWQSHNSCSAVWQKPILMGEKCELPRFSGLILYDQRGTPLIHQYEDGSTVDKQEKKADAVRTTLRDLL